MPAATVTTGAKPHGQQQLARDLEVERAVMGSAVGLKVSARCSDVCTAVAAQAMNARRRWALFCG